MKSRFIGAVLLVAGTTIGSGMLGLPIVTAFCGFYPSIGIIAIGWAFLLLSSFLMVDVNLFIEAKEVNVITMAEKTLGIWGKVLSWISYLFLLYALDVAYLSGGSQILGDWLPWPKWILTLLILLPLGSIIYSGIKNIDTINRFLMFGKLCIGYGILVIFIIPHIRSANVSHVDLPPLLLTLPIILQSFGFHTVISSLVPYLERDVKKLRWALTIGSFIALLVYALWELLVLGVVPLQGEVSLTKAYVLGSVSTDPLIHFVHQPLITVGALIFASFSILTAFLGVSLGLFDFLIDGLKMERNTKGKVKAFLVAFIPPLFFAISFPQVFIKALEYAGVFVAVIFGLIPVCMAWTLPSPSFWRKIHGRTLLITAAAFFLSAIILDVMSHTGTLDGVIAQYIPEGGNKSSENSMTEF